VPILRLSVPGQQRRLQDLRELRFQQVQLNNQSHPGGWLLFFSHIP
jgi:hypothetical protein